MLREIGTVVKFKNRIASISIPKEEKCNECKHCIRDPKELLCLLL